MHDCAYIRYLQRCQHFCPAVLTLTQFITLKLTLASFFCVCVCITNANADSAYWFSTCSQSKRSHHEWLASRSAASSWLLWQNGSSQGSPRRAQRRRGTSPRSDTGFSHSAAGGTEERQAQMFEVWRIEDVFLLHVLLVSGCHPKRNPLSQGL